MTDLTDVYSEYLLLTSRFTPTVALSDGDRFVLFKRGIRRMYVDTGRSKEYSPINFTFLGLSRVNVTLNEDEIYYILICAQIEFYKQMASDVAAPNRITQHKTDALTVTMSDKTNAEVFSIIAGLENELTQAYHKMPQYTGVENE